MHETFDEVEETDDDTFDEAINVDVTVDVAKTVDDTFDVTKDMDGTSDKATASIFSLTIELTFETSFSLTLTLTFGRGDITSNMLHNCEDEKTPSSSKPISNPDSKSRNPETSSSLLFTSHGNCSPTKTNRANKVFI
jgi:hypothetical protein